MKYKFTLLFISLILFYTPFSTILANAPKKYTPEYSNPFSESWRWRSYPDLNGRGCKCEDKKEQLYKYIWGILKKKNCHLYRINGVEDHIHIFTHLHPSISLANLIKDTKLAS